MRQGSSVTPSNSSSQVLHPVLQAALDGLDVELEEELTRYRRQRYRQSRQIGQVSRPIQSFTPKKSGSGSVPQRIQLPVMQETGSQEREAVAASAVGSTSARAAKLGELTDWALESQGSEPISGVAAPEDSALSSPLPPSLNHDLLSQVASLRTSADVSSPHALAIASVSANSSSQNLAEGEPGQESEQSALMAIESDLVEQESAQSDFSNAPDDYLESSEELLRSIAEETADRQRQREVSLLDSLLTPLGIGSMLLLLLSSATLGYVIMHPSSLDMLTAREEKGGNADLKTDAPEASSAEIPDSPNLAAEEFVDLNANSLSTIPGSAPSPSAALPNSPTANAASASASSRVVTPNAGGTSIATAPLPATIDPPAGSASTYVPPDPPAPEPVYIPEPQSEPVSVAPLPPAEPAMAAPAEVAAAPAAEQAAPSGNYYYVITPYSGDPSLETARDAVPDAYVRNFEAGANVQLGAFSDEARAEELIQHLENQGIQAELYQADTPPAPGQ